MGDGIFDPLAPLLSHFFLSVQHWRKVQQHVHTGQFLSGSSVGSKRGVSVLCAVCLCVGGGLCGGGGGLRCMGNGSEIMKKYVTKFSAKMSLVVTVL